MQPGFDPIAKYYIYYTKAINYYNCVCISKCTISISIFSNEGKLYAFVLYDYILLFIKALFSAVSIQYVWSSEKNIICRLHHLNMHALHAVAPSSFLVPYMVALSNAQSDPMHDPIASFNNPRSDP